MIWRRRPTLRARLTRSFIIFGMLGALAFGAAATVMVYELEDQFFESRLTDEATWLTTQFALRQAWPAPHSAGMQVYTAIDAMPPDLRTGLVRDVRRRELAGANGRHYHVRALYSGPVVSYDSSQPAAWLVSEVSRQLLVRPQRGHLLLKWAIVGAVVLVAAIGMAFYLARRLTTPLTELAQAVESRDPASGLADLQHLPSMKGSADHEVRVVAQALDAWSARAHAHIARERDFTRDASHELRTPLTVLHSTTTQVLRDPALPPASRRLLELAERSTTQLRHTIDVLLLLAREQQRSTIAETLEIRALIEQIVLDHVVALDERVLKAVVDVPRTATWPVNADVIRLVLTSLIGNALVHAASGPLTFALRDDVLHVRNNRVPHASGNAMSVVHGLGLPLVERLCAAAGLSVTVVESPTQFEVRLRTVSRFAQFT